MKSDVIHDFENAPWPALLINSSGEIVRANLAAKNIFGGELTRESARFASLWTTDNCITLDKFLRDGETALPPLTPLKLAVPGGSKVFSALVGVQLRVGGRLLMLQLLPDITELAGPKGVADNGLAHKQKLDCALQLARSVALDFNNALTSILGYTSLLLSKAEPTHPWRRTLLEVEKSAAKAAEIASDLAAFSRQDKEMHGQTAGNLNTVLQHCVEAFQNSTKAPPANWKLQLERRLFAAKFDEAKIQQAVVKILENALESLKTNGHIYITTRNVELAEATQDRNARLAAGAYVCAEIADDGAGIEADVLPRVFEPFYTTKRGSHRGLGLAWVYGIVTNHGGGVAVSSQRGAGTSVRLYLPASSMVVRDAAAYAGDLTGSQTILMVDDEDILLTMGETILSDYGYTVLTANSGAKALELITTGDKAIDLLITDLVMPVMSGRELVERFREVSPATRVLCTSGYVQPASQKDFTGYLQKPFTSQELLTRVKEILVAEPTAVD